MNFEDYYWMTQSSDPATYEFGRAKIRQLWPTKELIMEQLRKMKEPLKETCDE